LTKTEPYYIDYNERQPVRPGRLWFAVAAPPFIWAAHLTLCYVLVGLHCSWNLFPFTFLGLEGVRVVLLAVTIVAAAALIVAAVLAFGDWRRLTRLENPAEVDPTGRFRFMTALGASMAGLLTLVMFWSVFTILLNTTC
jgi:hypothetical protein